MTKQEGGEWIWAVVISLGVALVIVAPFFVLGIASGHDFEFHAASWLDAAGQWKEGIVFPRWTEWANHGFGEPRFIFYPPLSWILGAALGSAIPWNAVPVVFIVLVQTVAGWCAFALARPVTSRGAALFGAACYAANPYALLVVYMRSDFAEQLGTAFFPLLVLLALRASGVFDEEKARGSAAPLQSQRQRKDLALFALVFAVVWLSNAPAGVMASYGMTLVFAWAVLRRRSLSAGFRGAAGLTLGFGLTAFYLLPAAYEQRWVNIEQALSSGLQPAQNFLFTAINDPEHTWFNWIASGVAILLIVVTGIAAVFSHWRERIPEPAASPQAELRGSERGDLWLAVLILFAAATVLMLPITDVFWRLLPKLRFVQFPWRWMCMVAVCYAFFLGCAFRRARSRWIVPVVVAFLTVGTAAVLIPSGWWDTEDLPTLRAAIADGSGFDGTDEYDPRGDDHYNLPAKSAQVMALAAEESGDAASETQVRIASWKADEKRLRVTSPVPVRIRLRLLDYPGWRVEVNGRVVTPEHAEGSAQMIVPVGAGESEILARFVTTWDRKLGAMISLLSAVVFLCMLFVGRREILQIG
ncbi:MAG: hypothetical protein ABSG69_07585 [Candidatus Acidiferrum sp.]